MKITVFSTKPYDRRFLGAALGEQHAVTYLEARLTSDTAALAQGADGVCVFVNDQVDEAVLTQFKHFGIGLVTLRAAGYDNVDLQAAARSGIAIARVPAYSPEAVSEHAVALMLTLDRHTHRAFARVREGNFSLDGLLGFNLNGRTVGIVGTGRIGAGVARIMQGFGCRVLAYDVIEDATCVQQGVTYVPLDTLLRTADIISLHCPLTPLTRHLVDAAAIGKMKRGVMLINTSRGGIVDTRALIDGIKSGAIGHLGLDVYEGEARLFFEDQSAEIIDDDVFERLMTFPNVLVTGHQAFFTEEAMTAIAKTTAENIDSFARNGHPVNELVPAVSPPVLSVVPA